jgi:hypothetical protein
MGRDFRRLVVLKAQWYLIDLRRERWLIDHV